MCHILDELNSYIPVKRQTKRVLIEGEEFEIDDSKVFPILLFGDQLTVARARSASVIRSTADSGALDKFKGFVPAITDWHARACFLDVSVININFQNFKFYICVFRLSGKDFILASLQVIKEHYSS